MNTLDNEINEKKINETKEEVKVKYINLPLQFSSIRSEIIKKITEICESGDFILGNELNNFEKSFEVGQKPAEINQPNRKIESREKPTIQNQTHVGNY